MRSNFKTWPPNLKMGRKRNLEVKDENSIAKRQREEVVIITDSVKELVNRLSWELRRSVPSILVNYEGKENMDELIPHLVNSVSVDSNLASQIQESLGVEVYPSYEDCYSSVDQIEREIYQIHANSSNSDDPVDFVVSNSQSSKAAAMKEKLGTDSGNSSLNSDVFEADLSCTDTELVALLVDILSTTSNCLLENDKVFDGLPNLSLPLPPLPVTIVDQALDLKTTNESDGGPGKVSDVLPVEKAVIVLPHDDCQLSTKSSKEHLENDRLEFEDIKHNEEVETTPELLCSEPKIEVDGNFIPSNKCVTIEILNKIQPCTIDITRLRNPLIIPCESAVNKVNIKIDKVESDKLVKKWDKNDNSKDGIYADQNCDTVKQSPVLENEQIQDLQKCTKTIDASTKIISKVEMKQAPIRTRSKSRIVDSEQEILEIIDLEDSDAENHSTEEDDDAQEDSLNNNKTVEPNGNKSSNVWQPSVVLERIDPSKLAAKKTKNVTAHQVRRCISNMKNYLKLDKPNIQKINEAMEITFAYRRKMVIDPAISVQTVLKEFPALSLFEVVKCECDRLLGDKLNLLESLLDENFVRAASTKKIKNPHQLFIDARKVFKKTQSTEIKKIAGMVCLAFYLAEKQTVGSLFLLQKKKKKVVKKLTPMMILEEADLFTENREIRIFADGTEMLKVPNFYEGVLTIYALYYVLDIVYEKNLTLLFQYLDFLIGQPQNSFSTQPE